MENKPDFSADLSQALECLKKGGIILYPTDTIWGIGCDATNPEAVRKIYKLKNRADSKSMLVLVDNKESIRKLVGAIPEKAGNLLATAERPLTVIFENAGGVAPELLAEDKSLGIRITHEEFSNKLCHLLGRPLVSTSANISGEKAPSCFKEISEEIKSGVDYIVKYRQEDCSIKQPSSIIKITHTGDVIKIR